MALTITSPVTTYNVCDSITGWTGVDGIDGTEQIEGNGACASDVDIETTIMLGPAMTAVNMSTTKYAVYPWVKSFTASFLDIKANGGLFGVLSDGTNSSYWYINGSDTYPGGFEVMVFNSDATPDGNSGTAANLASITRIGVGFKGLSKSKLADNSFLDYVRYASGTALKITGSNTTTDDGWSEVLTGDTTLIAGVIKSQTGSYVLKGPVELGDGAGVLATTFTDDGSVIIFDTSPVGDNHHALACIGNATGATSVTFNNQTFIGAGGRFGFDQTDANLDSFTLLGGALTHAGAVKFQSGQTVSGVVFTDSLTTSIANDLTGCTLAVCGLITLETGGTLDACLIDEPTGAIGVTTQSPAGAALITNTEFISDGTGNGLEITGTAADMTLTDVDFTGYSATVDADKAIFVNIATGTMTINISGGSGVTADAHVRTAGAVVTVASSVPVTITVLDNETGLPIASTARVTLLNDSTKAELDSAAVNASGVYSYSYTGATPLAVSGWVREFSLTGTDYIQKDFSGEITSTGFSLTVRLVPIT